ncbi:MAG: tetraacyldisaccharide 4'-kinase [Deltaproteobacteria bacterium]|nr:tetraacyldisaccharide 4'-kinase [Deltaproteobacteria bacterium]
MKRPGWFDAREPSLGEQLALAPLTALSWCYGAGAALHRSAYARGFAEQTRLACKVVSVGSLVVGGSGKTPLAAWIAAQLHARGRRVTLASRGYGGTPRERVHVASDGARALEPASVVGDEALLLARLAPGVPVLVARARALAGQRAIEEFRADVLVLDDAFQHHALARDVDLVAFSAHGFGSAAVLPRGPLREPLAALSRAHAVLAPRLRARDEALLARYAPKAARFAVQREPRELRALDGARASEPPAWLAGREVGVLSALAHPRALRESAELLGARVVAERVFADHHRYEERDVAGLAHDAPLWVTSEKDAVKLDPARLRGADLRVLAEDVAAAKHEVFLAWLETRL